MTRMYALSKVTKNQSADTKPGKLLSAARACKMASFWRLSTCARCAATRRLPAASGSTRIMPRCRLPTGENGGCERKKITLHTEGVKRGQYDLFVINTRVNLVGAAPNVDLRNQADPI